MANSLDWTADSVILRAVFSGSRFPLPNILACSRMAIRISPEYGESLLVLRYSPNTIT